MAIASSSTNYGDECLERQQCGHVIWVGEPAHSVSSSSSSIPAQIGVDQPASRKKLKNRKIFPKGTEIPANVEIKNTSEDLTSASDSYEDNSSEQLNRRLSVELERAPQHVSERDVLGIDRKSQQFLAAGHVVFGTPPESAVGSSEHSDCRPKPEHQNASEKRVTDEHGNLTSIGSALHWQKTCKPCIFFHTEVGCRHALDCEFCHLPHNRKNNPRPGKGRRDRHKKLIEQRTAEFKEELAVRQNTLPCNEACDEEFEDRPRRRSLLVNL